MNFCEKIYFYFNKEELISAIERTIKFLEHSEESIWSNLTVAETIEILESELSKIKNGEEFNEIELAVLFTVASNIQEISMYNGWSKQYIEIAEVIDRFTQSAVDDL